MQWSPQQDRALVAVRDWLKRGRPQVFRLFGYAGTGKTTLAQRIAEDIDGETIFGAYTGKAALVMRARGCAEARTIERQAHCIVGRKLASDDACAWFLTKLSETSIKRMPPWSFFAYPQAMWISLWIKRCERLRKALRSVSRVGLVKL